MSSTKPNRLFALIDCNNFYASCERVFNPKLQNRPVVVLSNNDGCIIARSNEAKALGIPMGAPLFKYRPLIEQHDVAVCSSNYSLYGDMSQRVMQTLEQFSPDFQIYSIDEAFMLLEPKNCEEVAKEARKRVLQWTGIPVSIGIAPTKTLAKVANHSAKKNPLHKGVYKMETPQKIAAALKELPVTEVWGIGSRSGKKLARSGIYTAQQLAAADDHWIQKQLSITGLRTALELRGHSCLPLEEAPPPKKSICCSRSFGRPISALEELHEAISTFTAKAAEKTRRQHSRASFLTIFTVLHPFEQQKTYTTRIILPEPSNHTPTLISYAKSAIQYLFQPKNSYRKVGIILEGLVPEDNYQLDLFATHWQVSERQEQLMTTIDSINTRYGRGSLTFASEGVNPTWQMQRNHCSNHFTTSWEELLTIRI